MTSEPHLDADAKYQLGVISGKLDLLLVQAQETNSRYDARFNKIEQELDAQDERLTSLERSRTWVLGAAAALGTAASALASWLLPK